MIQPVRTITLNLRDDRADPTQLAWDLPAWGHPASMMVWPLFMSVEKRLIPIGSAFSVGGGIGFVMSAAHNVMEAVAREPRFDRWRTEGPLSGSISLSTVGLSVLHQAPNGSGGLTLNFMPLGSVEGAPPNDIVIGFATIPDGTQSLSVPLAFDFPERGDTVWSVGYCDFRYPEGGIPIDAVVNGEFDWQSEYSHRLRVVEAKVEAAFTGRFAAGFVDGPCFAFDQTIEHGMSGGPVLSETGYLVGLNSAGAETFFERPMSIGSMLFPLILTGVRSGRTFGPLTMNATKPLYVLIGQGIIRTDGSEERIGFTASEDGKGSLIHGVTPAGSEAVFDDFSAYRDGRRASSFDAPVYRLVRRQGLDGGAVAPPEPEPE